MSDRKYRQRGYQDDDRDRDRALRLAEPRLQAHLDSCPEAREQWNSTQKLKRDPRITPVGRLLRKTSMD